MQIKISENLVEYEQAMAFMDDHVEKMIIGKAEPLIWFLEHPPIYTAGTSANDKELIDKQKFKIYKTGRGGKYTYHGPGQRVVYLMLPLSLVNNDIRKYIQTLESIVIKSLMKYGIKSEIKEGMIGVWVNNLNKPKKISAIGVRVRKYITFHGFAINICPNLEDFKGIIPCGIAEYGVTSLKEQGLNLKVNSLDETIIKLVKSEFKI